MLVTKPESMVDEDRFLVLCLRKCAQEYLYYDIDATPPTQCTAKEVLDVAMTQLRDLRDDGG